MLRLRFELMMSTHPDNHYSRMTLGINGVEVTAYLRTDKAMEIRELVELAYHAGRHDVKVDSIQALEAIDA